MQDTGSVLYTHINTNLYDIPTKWILFIPILQRREVKVSLSKLMAPHIMRIKLRSIPRSDWFQSPYYSLRH